MWRNTLTQILSVLFVIAPLLAIRYHWNAFGRRTLLPRRFMPPGYQRWRLEVYSNHNQKLVESSMVDRSDIPFPVKQVTSARGELARSPGASTWALPLLEFDVDVDDPFAEDILESFLSVNHYVRFVTGAFASIDTASGARLLVHAQPYAPARSKTR